MAHVLYKRGTKSDFNKLVDKDENTIYFLKDSNEIYLGDNKQSNANDIDVLTQINENQWKLNLSEDLEDFKIIVRPQKENLADVDYFHFSIKNENQEGAVKSLIDDSSFLSGAYVYDETNKSISSISNSGSQLVLTNENKEIIPINLAENQDYTLGLTQSKYKDAPAVLLYAHNSTGGWERLNFMSNATKEINGIEYLVNKKYKNDMAYITINFNSTQIARPVDEKDRQITILTSAEYQKLKNTSSIKEDHFYCLRDEYKCYKGLDLMTEEDINEEFPKIPINERILVTYSGTYVNEKTNQNIICYLQDLNKFYKGKGNTLKKDIRNLEISNEDLKTLFPKVYYDKILIQLSALANDEFTYCSNVFLVDKKIDGFNSYYNKEDNFSLTDTISLKKMYYSNDYIEFYKNNYVIHNVINKINLIENNGVGELTPFHTAIFNEKMADDKNKKFPTRHPLIRDRELQCLYMAAKQTRPNITDEEVKNIKLFYVEIPNNQGVNHISYKELYSAKEQIHTTNFELANPTDASSRNTTSKIYYQKTTNGIWKKCVDRIYDFDQFSMITQKVNGINKTFLIMPFIGTLNEFIENIKNISLFYIHYLKKPQTTEKVLPSTLKLLKGENLITLETNTKSGFNIDIISNNEKTFINKNELNNDYLFNKEYQKEYHRVLNKLKQFKQDGTINDNTSVAIFISDLHSDTNEDNKYSENWDKFSKPITTTLKTIKKLTEDFDIDFLCFGGDYIDGNGKSKFLHTENPTSEEKQINLENAKLRINEINNLCEDLNVPYIILEGNHELSFSGTSGEYGFTHEEFLNSIIYHPEVKHINDFYYYDDHKHKIRYIGLNSGDTPGRVVKSDALSTTYKNIYSNTPTYLDDNSEKKSYGVVLLSHIDYGLYSNSLDFEKKFLIEKTADDAYNYYTPLVHIFGHTHYDYVYNYTRDPYGDGKANVAVRTISFGNSRNDATQPIFKATTSSGTVNIADFSKNYYIPLETNPKGMFILRQDGGNTIYAYGHEPVKQDGETDEAYIDRYQTDYVDLLNEKYLDNIKLVDKSNMSYKTSTGGTATPMFKLYHADDNIDTTCFTIMVLPNSLTKEDNVTQEMIRTIRFGYGFDADIKYVNPNK